MLKRKKNADILSWYDQGDSTALLVTGARQVGKSTLVRHLGSEMFEAVVEINLYENPQAKKALSEATDVEDLISRISLFSDLPLVSGHTLIFIDEIQELPDILTMAKFLVEDGRFRYAFSGSLLGVHLKQIRSYPVGFITEIPLFPLDFEEFCWALNVSDNALAQVRQCCKSLSALPDYLHEALSSYFRTYIIVGGMPEAILTYLDTKGDLTAVRNLQEQLVKNYQYDITKYANHRSLYIEEIFNQLPLQLDKESRRFVLNSVDSNARYESFRQDFVWLTTAGVALKCDQISNPKAPLRATERPGTFKLYESDTGMLVSRYPQTLTRAVYLDEKSVNQGAVFENVIAQQLAALELPLFYFMNRKRGEVDFITEGAAGDVVPIEVKSGSSPRAHAALNQLLENAEYDIPRGIVFSRLNIEQRGKVVYLPWYAIFCLKDLMESVEPLPASELPAI